MCVALLAPAVAMDIRLHVYRCWRQRLSEALAQPPHPKDRSRVSDIVSERLRRLTRNPLGSARGGSNPLGVVLSSNAISSAAGRSCHGLSQGDGSLLKIFVAYSVAKCLWARCEGANARATTRWGDSRPHVSAARVLRGQAWRSRRTPCWRLGMHGDAFARAAALRRGERQRAAERRGGGLVGGQGCKGDVGW